MLFLANSQLNASIRCVGVFALAGLFRSRSLCSLFTFSISLCDSRGTRYIDALATASIAHTHTHTYVAAMILDGKYVREGMTYIWLHVEDVFWSSFIVHGYSVGFIHSLYIILSELVLPQPPSLKPISC